jgi:hypothetical protein
MYDSPLYKSFEQIASFFYKIKYKLHLTVRKVHVYSVFEFHGTDASILNFFNPAPKYSPQRAPFTVCKSLDMNLKSFYE